MTMNLEYTEKFSSTCFTYNYLIEILMDVFLLDFFMF